MVKRISSEILFLFDFLIRIGNLKGYIEDVEGKGHWGTGCCRIRIKNFDDFEYMQGLIKQSLLYNKQGELE